MLKFNLTISDFSTRHGVYSEQRTVHRLTLAKAWRIAEHYRRKAIRQNGLRAAKITKSNWGWSVWSNDNLDRAYASITLA